MAATKFQELSDEQLVHKELSLERELIEASFRHRTSQLDDTSKLKKLRREIARVRTEQRSRELAGGLSTDALRNLHRGSFKAGAAPTSAADGGGFLAGITGKYGMDDAQQAE